MRRHIPVSLPGFVICGAELSLRSPLGSVTSRALLADVFCDLGIILYIILSNFSTLSADFHVNIHPVVWHMEGLQIEQPKAHRPVMGLTTV